LPFADGTISGVSLLVFRRIRRLGTVLLSVCAASLLLLELDRSLQPAETDASVAMPAIPWGDIDEKLILGVR
jgi:hypothetical protein